MPDHWHPTACWRNLQFRANMLSKIRQFFAERDILEVETPLACRATVTDPYIISMKTEFSSGAGLPQQLYLQTSPEYAMKRLLAAGSGAIYQICKAFRNGEYGRHHNPEFTLLEWYRPDYDHFALMDEVDEFLQYVGNLPAAEKISYADLFQKYLNVDPLIASYKQLCERIKSYELSIDHIATMDNDQLLQLLMSEIIEPKLGLKQPLIVYHFPASQAALARIHVNDIRVAERFEVYIQGVEIANGFHELTDATEQYQRFQHDLNKRKKLGYPKVTMDKNLLAALKHGLPNCAGVAVGIDRLAMVNTKAKLLADVLSFSIEQA